MANIPKEQIDQTLFHFLESIYLFEQREVAKFYVTWDEVYLLQLLMRNPGIQVSALSRKMKRADFIVSRMLTRLEKKNLVSRKKSETDKRVVMLNITEKGKAKISSIEEYNFKVVSSQLEAMNIEKVQVLMASMNRLGNFLGVDIQHNEEQ